MLRLKLAELEKLRVCQFGHVHSGYGWSFVTKASLRKSVQHIDQSQLFERTDFSELAKVKFVDELPFPIKLDVATRRGRTLTQWTEKATWEKAVEEGVDVMSDVALFVNAATDGFEQPIHFKLPVLNAKG